MMLGGKAELAAGAVEAPRSQNFVGMFLVCVIPETLQTPQLVRTERTDDAPLAQMLRQLRLRLETVGTVLAADP